MRRLFSFLENEIRNITHDTVKYLKTAREIAFFGRARGGARWVRGGRGRERVHMCGVLDQ